MCTHAEQSSAVKVFGLICPVIPFLVYISTFLYLLMQHGSQQKCQNQGRINITKLRPNMGVVNPSLQNTIQE